MLMPTASIRKSQQSRKSFNANAMQAWNAQIKAFASNIQGAGMPGFFKGNVIAYPKPSLWRTCAENFSTPKLQACKREDRRRA